MQHLLDRFLAGRNAQTARAYRLDLEDFGRFVGEPPAAAVARLLTNGPAAGRTLLMDFVIDLRRRGLAPATIERRCKTLHAVAATAHDMGVTDWTLETPAEAEVVAALRTRATQASYLLPRHPNEVNRLDLQHYALRGVVGRNHLAPVTNPRRVLDVGAGTGQWGFDVCEAFPGSVVVGIDLVLGKPDAPRGYRSVRGNVLQGLPFLADVFDLVHQRFLVTGVPTASWRDVVADMVRVTRPGGWVELVEPMMTFERAGPATKELMDLLLETARALELDTTGEVYRALDVHLARAGLVDVARHELALPIGHWEGQVGAFMAADYRAVFTRFCETMEARGRLSAAEGHRLIEQALRECEERRTLFPFAIAFGRKAPR